MSLQNPTLTLNPAEAEPLTSVLSLSATSLCGLRCAVSFPGLVSNKLLLSQSFLTVFPEGHPAIVRTTRVGPAVTLVWKGEMTVGKFTRAQLRAPGISSQKDYY